MLAAENTSVTKVNGIRKLEFSNACLYHLYYVVFVDIGASVVIFSLQAAKFGLVKEIHSFELDTLSYTQLLFNIHLNGFTDIVHPHPEAVTSKNSQVVRVPDAQGKNLMGRLTPGMGTTQQLMGLALDENLPYRGKKIFLKIAVQGHESDVLKGAVSFLLNNTCFIEISLWPENSARVLQEFAALGYKVVHSIRKGYYYLAQ